MLKTAQHRPAIRRRRFRHDNPTALDMFSGFGGLTQGIEIAGFTTIMAANHNEYKVEIHEANFPEVEHWIADLVNPESADYHDARDLPAADLLVAGVSCVNHSQANTKKAYAQGLSLFDLDDPEYEECVTRSERDRATANCVLHYAALHHPRLILVECTTELQSWGYLVPGRKKVADGSTYRWWLHQFELLGYRYRELYLNSMFFGVPQSRDRLYICMWDEKLPTPDLEHRPLSHCVRCGIVEGVWTWKTGVPPTGSVRYGKQYNYRCPRCRAEVLPAASPSLYALDLTDLGTRIGDRKRPLAAATMARAERCRQRFADFPAVLMPAKTARGSERHPWQPMATQTSQQETALLSTGMVVPGHRHNADGQPISEPMDTVTGTHEKALLSTGAIMQIANSYEHPRSQCRTRDLAQPLWTQLSTNSTGLLTPPVAMALTNYQGAARGVDEPLPTQGGSETMGLVSAGVVPFRRNTVPTTHGEPMPTVTAEQVPGLLTAAGFIKNNGSIDEAAYRAHPLDEPLGALTSDPQQSLLFSGWFKQNGSTGTETAPHPVLDPFGTLISRDTTALLTAEWREMLADLTLEDCYFRMFRAHEVGRGCGFDVDFPGHTGSFVVWGSQSDQVDGYGNAVSPQVGYFIGSRLRACLHGDEAAA